MKRVGLWMIGAGLFITVMLFPPAFEGTEPTAGANAYGYCDGCSEGGGGDD
jgi:hypothetical protein